MSQNKKSNLIEEKTLSFAIEISRFVIALRKRNELILGGQILKSGTNPGAMIRESKYAESNKDFIHKLQIAQKEANETDYWLELISEVHSDMREEALILREKCQELLRILSSIIKTCKAKNK